MDLMEAEHLLRRWNPDSEPATPRIIEALDLVQFEQNSVQATARVACPTCGARLREVCAGGVTHRRRINKLRTSLVHSTPQPATAVKVSL